MERRTLKCLPLTKTNDEVFKITWLNILTESSLESIKLPTNFDNYKYSHMIRPDYLLEIEIIKTRKNWILKNILNYEKIQNPLSYNDYLKQSEITKIILKNLHPDQETNILGFVVRTFMNESLDLINLKNFEKQLESNLGFA